MTTANLPYPFSECQITTGFVSLQIITGATDLLLLLKFSRQEKPYFLFPHVPKKWSFPKSCTGIWSFLYHQERWYCFMRKYDLSFRQKMKDNLFSKNYMKIYFLQIFWKDGLSKKVTLEYDLSCIIWKDDICLYAKIWCFFFGQKMEDDLSFTKNHISQRFMH